MPAIELHLRIRVPPGGADPLRAFLRQATPFYESPGGIQVRLLQDRADPDRFIELIHYADEATYLNDQHRVEHDPQMRHYLERWRTLLAEPPTVEVYADHTGANPPRPPRSNAHGS